MINHDGALPNFSRKACLMDDMERGLDWLVFVIAIASLDVTMTERSASDVGEQMLPPRDARILHLGWP